MLWMSDMVSSLIKGEDSEETGGGARERPLPRRGIFFVAVSFFRYVYTGPVRSINQSMARPDQTRLRAAVTKARRREIKLKQGRDQNVQTRRRDFSTSLSSTLGICTDFSRHTEDH